MTDIYGYDGGDPKTPDYMDWLLEQADDVRDQVVFS
jgi:hypothetical protein